MKLSIVIPTIKPQPETQDLFHTICSTVSHPHEDFEVVYSGFNQSAAKNRNYCLEKAKGDIIIQVDDDVYGFYPGWEKPLVEALQAHPDLVIVSAELHKPGAPKSSLMGLCILQGRAIVASACIAHRKTPIRFDEEYEGSGFEDNDFCLQMMEASRHPNIAVSYDCKLYHKGEAKNRNPENWKKNQKHYQDKWFHLRQFRGRDGDKV